MVGRPTVLPTQPEVLPHERGMGRSHAPPYSVGSAVGRCRMVPLVVTMKTLCSLVAHTPTSSWTVLVAMGLHRTPSQWTTVP